MAGPRRSSEFAENGRGVKPAPVDRLAEQPAADARADLETGDKGTQDTLFGTLPFARQGQYRGPGRTAQMRQAADVGVVEIETVREGAVDQGGDDRGSGSRLKNRRQAVRVPVPRHVAGKPPGGLVVGADGHRRPVGETHSRGIQHP